MATFTITTTTKTSNPPTVIGDNRLPLSNAGTHVFTIANFTTETSPQYLDPEGDDVSKFKLVSTTYLNGSLKLNGVDVAINDEIDKADIDSGLLTYVDDGLDPLAHQTLFEFTLSDTGSNSFSLETGNVGFKVLAESNLAPTEVGDVSETIAFGESLVFTRAMFTTGAIPPYSDPEGDGADKLKITSLPSVGKISLNGAFVTANQEIDFNDIDSGLLIFNGDISSISGGTSTFDYEISDLGSGVFVG